MGRTRKVPKDEKEAKEWDRLRRNQQRCRDRKLGMVDQYNERIETIKQDINDKITEQQRLLQEFNQLRLSLQTKLASLTEEEKEEFTRVSTRIDAVENGFIALQQFVRREVMNVSGCHLTRRKQDE